jgi:hypothetical protein
MKNLSERYKADLSKLVERGKYIAVALQYECQPENAAKTGLKKEQLPDARAAYQPWYSEALACVRQLLPDRTEDFIAFYKPAKPRKGLDWGNYTMSDYLIGATIYDRDTLSYVVPSNSALSAIYNQYIILSVYLCSQSMSDRTSRGS